MLENQFVSVTKAPPKDKDGQELPLRPKEGIENKDFKEKLRAYVAESFLDLLTEPRSTTDTELYEHFLRGEKIEPDISMRDRFVYVCQKIRLSVDEIDTLRNEWFINRGDIDH